MHNMWLKFIKEYYKLGFYTLSDLEVLVKSGAITEDEKKEIIDGR